MSFAKWWRVTDPLNPLCGCDVRLGNDKFDILDLHIDANGNEYATVTGLRRLDVLVGDRPFQLINPAGDVGVMVNRAHLEPSPVQDDIVEIGYDLPYGKCLSEEAIVGPDGDELRVVDYERAIQVAYGEAEGELYATCTLRGEDRGDRYQQIRAMFESKLIEHETLVARMKQENR